MHQAAKALVALAAQALVASSLPLPGNEDCDGDANAGTRGGTGWRERTDGSGSDYAVLNSLAVL